MEGSIISIIISIIALFIAVYTFYQFRSLLKDPEKQEGFNTIPLRLQAYERLVVLCERIGLPNLISRLNEPELSAKEMQVLLLENIKQEFEYNTSQQIYVSQVAWEAVRNLRDQSMLIVNQVAGLLPADAKATDLNKQLLEIIISQNDTALHTIVLDALNYEAKKLLRAS